MGNKHNGIWKKAAVAMLGIHCPEEMTEIPKTSVRIADVPAGV
jgi:hypothetical protein